MQRSTSGGGVFRRQGYRWTICALIFFATTVNYLDRQVFSLLVPFFENELRLGPTDLALINVSFALPYGLAMVFVGSWIDRVGVKRGLGSAFLLWNVAAIGHALVGGLGGFMVSRTLLGLGESGMFPAAVKTMAEWFPRRERSFATAVFNAGANLGAILAPLLGVAIASAFGWRACFILTGFVGLVWILFWGRLYGAPEGHPKVTDEELAIIREDPEEGDAPLTYAQLFALRPIYGLALAKALSDAPWWFYLTWMPKFLVDQFHVTPLFMAFAIPVIYIVADVGSLLGGLVSSRLIARGVEVGSARKRTMLAAALLVTPVMAVGWLVDQPDVAGIPSVYLAVAITALAAGAHQGWSCNLFTLISDTVPRGGVAMAVGAINGFAMVGVAAMQLFVGRSVEVTGSYILPFVAAGSLYLVALVVLQLFLPRVYPFPTTRRASLPLVATGAALVLVALGTLQITLNRPPYASLDDYLASRGREIVAPDAPRPGPEAKVGWMDARWYLWHPVKGEPKVELVKLDRQGRPYIEPKGVKASHYVGPDTQAVESALLTP